MMKNPGKEFLFFQISVETSKNSKHIYKIQMLSETIEWERTIPDQMLFAKLLNHN